MTAASFFEVEEAVDEPEARGTKRKREPLESSAPSPTVSLQSTSTVVASYIPVSRFLHPRSLFKEFLVFSFNHPPALLKNGMQ